MRWIKLIRVVILGMCLLAPHIGLEHNNAQVDYETEATDGGTVASQNVSLIELKHGLLTVKVHNIWLKELIEEIARQGDLTLMVNASLKEKVTLEFQKLPLEAGLRRILRNHSYALVYGKRRWEKTQVIFLLPRKLWIHVKGVGKSSEQIVAKKKKGYTQTEVMAKPEWHDAMLSEDPERRQEAYDAIVKALPAKDPGVLEEVEASLREFERTMTEQDLEAESEPTHGSELKDIPKM